MSLQDLHTLYKDIKDARAEAKRPAEDVSLMLASKTQSAETIEPFLKEGHRLFGENRVQEAAQKWPDLKSLYPDTELHLIGPLQSNKVKQALKLFDVIETLDREKLAKALHDHGCTIPCYIQINTGEEEQKSGIIPQEADAFITYCRQDCNLDIQGLMCIPPAIEPCAPHFALLHRIAEKHDIPNLSMGMSNDYPVAIAFGATQIRVGRAVFGARD